VAGIAASARRTDDRSWNRLDVSEIQELQTEKDLDPSQRAGNLARNTTKGTAAVRATDSRRTVAVRATNVGARFRT
jgi:hypothetical protein